QGADAKQVVGVLQLARGVAGEGQAQVVLVDAAAVIDDADAVDAALLDLDVDARAAGVHRVLQQFLDDAGRALNDLARGDLGDHLRRQLADSPRVGAHRTPRLDPNNATPTHSYPKRRPRSKVGGDHGTVVAQSESSRSLGQASSLPKSCERTACPRSLP